MYGAVAETVWPTWVQGPVALVVEYSRITPSQKVRVGGVPVVSLKSQAWRKDMVPVDPGGMKNPLMPALPLPPRISWGVRELSYVLGQVAPLVPPNRNAVDPDWKWQPDFWMWASVD